MHDINAPPGDTPLHFPQEDHLNPTKSLNQITHNAKIATDKEHKMTLLQGIRLYPKAIAWSVLISTCICMEGYDVCLLSSFCKSKSRTDRGNSVVDIFFAMNQMRSLYSTKNMEPSCPTGHIRYQPLGSLVLVT